ncbi:hypothetical protein GCM10009804_53330 [Kribbella hippodromi]|uniref:Uncharacterized protein n=1 Tax=Kribbella hippodromi TaxID=434347 RepID=A0ABP4PTW2_9ACTN
MNDDDSGAAQRTAARAGGHAPEELTEREIQELVARCPEQQRWAFEGWLRGVRQLDGDPIVSMAP